MFKAFDLFKSQQQPQPEAEEIQSQLQVRMNDTIKQFASMVPGMYQPMLSSLLPGLAARMTDEQIRGFIAEGRRLFDYIEQGTVPEDDSNRA